MTCPDCGHDNPAEARFCGRCGVNLVAEAATPTAGPTPEGGVDRPRQLKAICYWGIALLTLLVFVGVAIDFFFNSGHYTVGRYAWTPYVWASLLVSLFGACLWGGVTGKWPGTRRRINPIVRVLLPLVAIVLNLSAAFGVGYFGEAGLGISVRGQGIVTSEPKGIRCGAWDACGWDYGPHTVVQLSAQPDPGWELESIFGNCDAGGRVDVGPRDRGGGGCLFLFVPGGPGMAKLQVTIEGQGNVSVSQPPGFGSPPSSTISKFGSGEGWGSGCNRLSSSCHFAYDIGEEVDLIAVAPTEQGGIFVGWENDCEGFETEQIATLTMDIDKVCVAKFTWP